MHKRAHFLLRFRWIDGVLKSFTAPTGFNKKLSWSSLTQLNQCLEAQLDPQDSHYNLQGDWPSILTHASTPMMHMPQWSSVCITSCLHELMTSVLINFLCWMLMVPSSALTLRMQADMGVREWQRKEWRLLELSLCVCVCVCGCLGWGFWKRNSRWERGEEGWCIEVLISPGGDAVTLSLPLTPSMSRGSCWVMTWSQLPGLQLPSHTQRWILKVDLSCCWVWADGSWCSKVVLFYICGRVVATRCVCVCLRGW